jgi:pantoate--beta-alanine ligase
MRIETEINKVRTFIHRARRNQASIGFVPTMGALHEGHLSLIRRSVLDTDVTVVSVFVNPTQFGPGEDFDAYPRRLRDDSIAAESAGAHLIFAPTVAEMYPPDASTFVEVEKLTDGLCGQYRSGHFRGVTTVVTKLFNIVLPDRAYFGLKDYQQYAVIRRMTRDLNLPIEVVGLPTVREQDGLATSSRNAYLTPEQREVAPVLYHALQQAAEAVRQGASLDQAKAVAASVLDRIPQMRVQYLEAVHPDTLEPATWAGPPVVLAAAVFLGETRLIDNVVVMSDE